MLKKILLLSGYILVLGTTSSCVTTNAASLRLLEENKAVVRGQTTKGLSAWLLSKDRVGKHTEINILAIDGTNVSENEQSQVVVQAGQRQIKVLCNLRYVEVDRIIGTTATTRVKATISNEVVYLLNAEAGHRYQLVSELSKEGKCTISTEEYGIPVS